MTYSFFSKDPQEHQHHVRLVLQRLLENRLFVKAEKFLGRNHRQDPRRNHPSTLQYYRHGHLESGGSCPRLLERETGTSWRISQQIICSSGTSSSSFGVGAFQCLLLSWIFNALFPSSAGGFGGHPWLRIPVSLSPHAVLVHEINHPTDCRQDCCVLFPSPVAHGLTYLWISLLVFPHPKFTSRVWQAESARELGPRSVSLLVIIRRVMVRLKELTRVWRPCCPAFPPDNHPPGASFCHGSNLLITP
ncbi:uncharacterized protein LOC133632506 isoform X4 [Entelurus aequoreus]|uniref:uncharacterized protein LOC133632506 isoform X4 n=1 Tax=Entelurus aequoreus TaxID=161455 RepID=UPI002B1E3C38|nr:uncharacterized protein LOC133632506 isoform X4 [Entelurus aequoreus]